MMGVKNKVISFNKLDNLYQIYIHTSISNQNTKDVTQSLTGVDVIFVSSWNG